MNPVRSIFATLLFLCAAIVARSENTWSWSNPLPQGDILSTVTYGNGWFVAGGNSNRLLRSQDGDSWELSDSLELRGIVSIEYGNGVFVALGRTDWLGSAAPGPILTSADGLHWARVFQTDEPLIAGSFAGGQFFAVTKGAAPLAILSSTNGVIWNYARQNSLAVPSNVAFGQNEFLVIEGSDVLVSPDGLTWTRRSTILPYGFRAVTFDANKFVAVGNSTAGNIATSDDGVAWTIVDTQSKSTLYSVTFGNGLFVAVGDALILTSPDGLSWSRHQSELYFAEVSYGNGRFVAVGGLGNILTSTDGITWTQELKGSTPSLESVTYGDSGFVAVGGGRESRLPLVDYVPGSILLPSGAAGWTALPMSLPGLHAVTFAQKRYLAVGDRGVILESTNRLQWTRIDSQQTNSLRSVCYGDDKFVIVGDHGTILNLKDGQVMNPHVSDDPNLDLYSIAWGRRKFVAVGFVKDGHGGPLASTGGTLLASDDGTNWIPGGSNVGPFSWLYGVAYGNEYFVAVGPSACLRSKDGITWERIVGLPSFPHSTPYLEGITYAAGVFIAVDGTIRVSTDGQHWQLQNAPHNLPLFGAGYGGGTFLVVGHHGTILSSSLSNHLFLTEPRIAGSEIAFQVLGAPGARYEVQAAADLSKPVWSTVTAGTINGDGSASVQRNTSERPLEFYRISTQP